MWPPPWGTQFVPYSSVYNAHTRPGHAPPVHPQSVNPQATNPPATNAQTSHSHNQRHAYYVAFAMLRIRKNVHLPKEIMDKIVSFTAPPAPRTVNNFIIPRVHPASIPPPDRSSPFMKLPAELRRAIFADSLTARDKVYYPRCEDEDEEHPHSRPAKTARDLQPRRNFISGLMALNRTVRDEVAEVLYEERKFIIHVHGRIRNGGIEFLDTGRQPLQYKDVIEDPRFDRFGISDRFGFHRLKKIEITIYQATDECERHAVINTYFMNLALCQLLERYRHSSNRIKSIEISFSKPTDATDKDGDVVTQNTDQYWWDANRRKPRATSIHNLSNIELVLRPFAYLTGCHRVNIDIPTDLWEDSPTLDFLNSLRRSMMSTNGPTLSNEALMVRIETARAALSEYIVYSLHGTGYHYVPPLTEEEITEDADASTDKFWETSRKRLGSGTDLEHHENSKRPRRDSDIEVDDDETRTFQASHDTLHEDEERMIRLAMQASLEDFSKQSTYEHLTFAGPSAWKSGSAANGSSSIAGPSRMYAEAEASSTQLPIRQNGATQASPNNRHATSDLPFRSKDADGTLDSAETNGTYEAPATHSTYTPFAWQLGPNGDFTAVASWGSLSLPPLPDTLEPSSTDGDHNCRPDSARSSHDDREAVTAVQSPSSSSFPTPSTSQAFGFEELRNTIADAGNETDGGITVASGGVTVGEDDNQDRHDTDDE